MKKKNILGGVLLLLSSLALLATERQIKITCDPDGAIVAWYSDNQGTTIVTKKGDNEFTASMHGGGNFLRTPKISTVNKLKAKINEYEATFDVEESDWPE